MELKRAEKMTALAMTLTHMIHAFGNRKDDSITIEYGEFTEEKIRETFTPWGIKYHGILPGIEYFLVYENDPDCGKSLLYVVNVSGDSEICAASELMALACRKCL